MAPGSAIRGSMSSSRAWGVLDEPGYLASQDSRLALSLLPLAIISLPHESEHMNVFREDLWARTQLLGSRGSGREREVKTMMLLRQRLE